MDPHELVTLARRLADQGSEVALRAAASRAYYGAFHLAGEKLEALTAADSTPFRWTGVRKYHSGNGTPQDHSVQTEWASRRGASGTTIANLLAKAHDFRKRADYDLHISFTGTDKDQAFSKVAELIWVIRKEH